MAVSWLHRLAAQAPVAVFPALGMHGEEALRALALAPNIEVVDSPRHASVLLVAGGVPPDLHESLRRVHDQHPEPFSVVWFRSEPLPELAEAIRIDDLDVLPEALLAAHRDLMLGRRGGSPKLLPDVPPNPWQGLGDDGHGGEGMMGGVPYGRPMAMNMHDDIRDGLTLDSLTFRLGPFLPMLPAGLGAEVTLQGDLIQTWTTQLAPYPVALDRVFLDACRYPTPIAELELARARYHLHRLFHGLRLAGLESLGMQALRLANTLDANSSVQGLQRRVQRCGFLALSAPGRGRLTEEQARHIGGPAARAAGLDDDLRLHDAHYRRLGFTPICHAGGDTRARWRQCLAEIEQSLQLARQAAAEDLKTTAIGSVETPRGPWHENRRPADASRLLDALLPGLEWDEALASIASLDLAAVSEWPADSRSRVAPYDPPSAPLPEERRT